MSGRAMFGLVLNLVHKEYEHLMNIGNAFNLKGLQ
jgi:hypothetical protein